MTEPMTEQYASERIRLAEAMGWRYEFYEEPELSVRGMRWRDPSGSVHVYYKPQDPPFNPFKYANDDYAVLEWMRTIRGRETWIYFKNALAEVGGAFSCNYKIGDYARAALRVLAQSMRYPDGFKCVHCGYIGDVSEPPHVCEELEQTND